jgi:hypothetical protein
MVQNYSVSVLASLVSNYVTSLRFFSFRRSLSTGAAWHGTCYVGLSGDSSYICKGASTSDDDHGRSGPGNGEPS